MIDYDVYALAGDGCMMEGISREAASLAGHLGLSNLCWIYDNNHITIEGNTALAFTEDVATRFLGYGWNVLRVGDANDLDLLARAFATFKKTTDRPTLIIVDSHIGYGAPNKQDTSAAHGEPLGEDEIRATKKNYGWPEDAKFLVPDGVYEHFEQGIGARGKKLRSEWMGRFERVQVEVSPTSPTSSTACRSASSRRAGTRTSPSSPLTRRAREPRLVGEGARTPSPSTCRGSSAARPISRRPPRRASRSKARATSKRTRRGGKNLHFGVREHAMGAILNGLALCKLRPFGSGFLIFSDYMRAPIRLRAIMELPVMYVFTHDSIGVGEDGPTHQPIEQLASPARDPRPRDAFAPATPTRWPKRGAG